MEDSEESVEEDEGITLKFDISRIPDSKMISYLKNIEEIMNSFPDNEEINENKEILQTSYDDFIEHLQDNSFKKGKDYYVVYKFPITVYEGFHSSVLLILERIKNNPLPEFKELKKNLKKLDLVLYYFFKIKKFAFERRQFKNGVEVQDPKNVDISEEYKKNPSSEDSLNS